jgi:Alginate lyase
VIVFLGLAVLVAGGVYLISDPGGVHAAPNHVPVRDNNSSPSSGSPLSSGPSASSGPSPNPAAVLNLTDWKLQIPVASSLPGQVEEVNWPALRTYSSWYFQVNQAGDGVVFRAAAGGATTPGTVFARTELRQMTDGGRNQAAWSSANSTWRMTIREAITHLPPVHPAIVAGQIHGMGTHFVALVRLDGHLLWVKTEAGSGGSLDENYQIGTIFTLEFVASGDVIRIYYNGALKVELHEQCIGCYFKAGAYLQSNTNWDAPNAYGEVVIYGLTVSGSSH